AAHRHQDALQEALAVTELAVREVTSARAAALATWNAANADDPALAAWRSELDAMQRAARLVDERAGLIVRHDDAERCVRRIERIDETLATLPHASDATVAELERLVELERDLKSALEAARTSLTFTPEREIAVRAMVGELERDETLEAGRAFQVAGDGRITLTLAEIGTIEVCGPVIDLSASQRDLAAALVAIEAIENETGGRSPLVLRTARMKVEALSAERSEFLERRAQALGDATPLAIAARIATIDNEDPKPNASNEREALEATISERAHAVTERRTAVRSALDVRENALNAATVARDFARREDTDARVQRLVPLAERVRVLTEDGASDRERAAHLASVHAASETAHLKLESERKAYAPYADIEDPHSALCDAEVKADTLAHIAQGAALHREQLRTRLEAQRDRAPVAERARLDEARAQLLRALERERCDERALALLCGLVDDAERARIEGFAAPVLARVAPWYEHVTGKALAALDLDEHHAMRGLRLAGLEHEIEFDELSAGAADQLGLLVRLGYAALLTMPERLGPMPLLLDDPLVNGDERRRGRLLDVLHELSQQAQVIIFTCRPEDYAKASGRFVRIGDLALAERAS
ncbi:MAG: hypothetical protein ABI346_07640, partial [Candidatus Baltobacteraceae bacterium]